MHLKKLSGAQMNRFALLVLLCLPIFAHAQSTDAEFAPLLKDRKIAEVEKLANERIAANPKDDVAIWHLASVSANDPVKRDAVIVKAEACAKALPNSAKCHHALGRLYGAAAMSSGMMDGIKYASRIKDEFAKAVEFAPMNFDARRDLNQFYLQAPGIAGGSVRKAIANCEDLGKINAAQGKLLRAEVHFYEKEFDKAETILASLKQTPDEVVARTLPQAWASLGFAMIGDKQPGKAQSLFERLVAIDMDSALLHFGLGRAQLENNAVDAAIASMERALKIDGRLNAHYRLGIAYQTKGDKPKAIAALQQFLSYATNGKAMDDAKQRLENLKKTS
jgi:tetratricopeptide (TPR) repeat protein